MNNVFRKSPVDNRSKACVRIDINRFKSSEKQDYHSWSKVLKSLDRKYAEI